MSRAEQLKPGDVSLGQTYEFFRAFGKAGGTIPMVQKLIEDSALMCSLVERMMEDAIMAAVEKGVKVEDGHYVFEDPGFSLNTQFDLPIVRNNDLIRISQVEWCRNYGWAKLVEGPKIRRLRIPIDASFGKIFQAQERELLKEENLPSTRIVTMFLIINCLATGTRLLPNCEVRCLDMDNEGHRVTVGNFKDNGFGIGQVWDVNSNPATGIAGLRN